MSERKTACDILIRVEKGGFANLLMLSLPKELEARQTAFVTTLVYGTLERRITLDYLLSSLVKGGLDRLDIEVLTILRMSAYQLLYLDGVPTYAALNEGVKLCRMYRKSSACGMVNAVLRRIKSVPVSEDLHIKYSLHPDIVELWKKDYPTRYTEIAQNSLGRCVCCIYTNIKKTTPDELSKLLAEEGVTTQIGFAENTLLCEGEPPVKTSAFSQGLFHVIGTTSALAAQVAISKKPDNALDLCAAPGGKTAILAMHAESVVAAELKESRMSTIKALTERLGLDNVITIQNDATCSLPKGEYDAVLCDVPCTGTGVLSKRPELRAVPPDVEVLVDIQSKILDCALSRRENDIQIKQFLGRTPCMRPLPLPFEPPKNCDIGDGFATFFPDKKTFDGFFVAFLEKVL